MTELVVIERAEVVPSLDELAATIKSEHSSANQALESTVQHAIRAGEALLLARAQVPRGWYRWCAENLDIPYTRLGHYIRFASFKEIVKDAPTINAARHLLNHGGYQLETGAPPKFDHEAARRLHESGWSAEKIGELLGASKASIYRALSDEGLARSRKLSAASKRRRDAAKRAAKQQIDGERAARIGGGINATYKSIRRAMTDANSLSETGDTPEVRQRASTAYRRCALALDEIVTLLADA